MNEKEKKKQGDKFLWESELTGSLSPSYRINIRHGIILACHPFKKKVVRPIITSK